MPNFEKNRDCTEVSPQEKVIMALFNQDNILEAVAGFALSDVIKHIIKNPNPNFTHLTINTDSKPYEQN